MPRRISIHELTADVKSGMGYSALSRKYRLSREKLQGLLVQMVERGMVTQAEVEGIGPSAPTVILDSPPSSSPQSAAATKKTGKVGKGGVRAPSSGTARYTISEFVRSTEQQDRNEGLFEMEGDRLLEINLNGKVWTKMGSMVAYLGDIKFTREGVLEHGMGRLLKKSVSGEGTKLTKAEGKGTLYLADTGKKISILTLEDDAIFVNGNDVLAFEDSIQWDIRLMKKISSVLAGGLTNIELKGSGMVAITTHYEPLTLRVTPNRPVTTDPNATVAWSGTLEPELKTDVSFRTLLGRGSGESIQMFFQGDGFVVVQPFEEAYFQG